MVKIFPFIFILLWSSAFITTKPIINNSDPFAALTFRFALVAFGFFIFSKFVYHFLIFEESSLVKIMPFSTFFCVNGNIVLR